MNDKITLFRVQGHNGFRCQKQINKIRFFKDFDGTEQQCHEQAKAWWGNIKAQYKDRWDGTKTWAFFKEKWEEWARLETRAKQPLADRTISEYKWAFRQAERLVRPLRYLADITLQSLRQARGVLVDEALSKGADNYAPNKFVNCMRASLLWAMERGYMADIPLDNFHTLPVAEPEVRTQSTREIELLLKYGTTQERVVVLLGFDCGCRPDEMINILVENFDFETGFADIVPHPADPHKGITAWHPKKWKIRQLRLTPRLIAEIKTLNPQGPYLVCNKYGEKFSGTGFSTWYTKFVARVNEEVRRKEKDPIKLVGTCKTLRKDYSTSRQGQGATIEETGKSMGHASKQVTRKHYTNTFAPEIREQERERLRKLDKYIVPLNYTPPPEK